MEALMGAFYAALDVGDKTTAICIVDGKGEIVEESSVETTPAAIALFLKRYKRTLERVGQETGTKAAWLHKELVRKKYPMICFDARIAHALLSTQRNKTDKNDARALAQLVLNGWSSESHIKSDEAFRWRMVLSHRRILKRKALAIDLLLRDALKLIGGQLEQNRQTLRLRACGKSEPLVLMLTGSMLRARKCADAGSGPPRWRDEEDRTIRSCVSPANDCTRRWPGHRAHVSRSC
jgi:transposase